jgi:hypothetical protein
MRPRPAGADLKLSKNLQATISLSYWQFLFRADNCEYLASNLLFMLSSKGPRLRRVGRKEVELIKQL